MKLPSELVEEYRKHAEGDPLAVARAIYDLDGGLGETYVITDGTSLMLCSRKVGGTPHVRYFPFNTMEDVTIRDEGSFAGFRFRVEGRDYALRFSLWDRAPLEQIRDLWSHLVQPALTKDLDAPTLPSSELPSPLTAFCATLHALMQCDGSVDSKEMEWLVRQIPRPEVIEASRKWLETHGTTVLLQSLSKVLSPAQQRCLLANLLTVAVADGRFRRAEQEFLQRVQQSLSLGAEEMKQLLDALLLKINLAVFAEAGAQSNPDWPPLVIFSAAGQALIEGDQNLSLEESAALQHLLDDPELAFQGAMKFQSAGEDGVIRAAAAHLNHTQKRCLVANLISLALEDGLFRSREKALLRRFSDALGLSTEEYQPLQDSILARYDMSVFAE